MSHNLPYTLGRITLTAAARLLLDMDIVYQSPIDGGAKIIAPNHPTTVDPFLVPTYFGEQVHILITESAFKAPIFGRYLRAAGHIPVITGNGKQAFETAKSLLMAGRTVAIFPEGTLSPIGGGHQKPHTGVARLALMTGAPIVPVGIGLERERIRLVNTGITNSSGIEEIAQFYANGRYAVTIGTPMTLSGNVQNREHVYRLTDHLMGQIMRLSRRSEYRIHNHSTTMLDTAEIPGL